MRGDDEAQSRGPLVGYALEIINRRLQFECLDTPHEVLEKVRARGLDFRTLLDDIDTGVKSVEVFQPLPRMEFSGGPHAQAILEVLEALDASDVKRVAKEIARDPEAVRTDDEGGALPLLAAVSARNTEAVRTILRAGAGVDRSNQFAMTPLHWAAALGEAEIAAALLEGGSDARRLSWFFVMPIELASLNGNSDVERVIKRFDAYEVQPFSIKLVLTRMGRA